MTFEFDYMGDSAAEPDMLPAEHKDVQNTSLADIDLNALAQRVYSLLKEELRTERERLGYSR